MVSVVDDSCNVDSLTTGCSYVFLCNSSFRPHLVTLQMCQCLILNHSIELYLHIQETSSSVVLSCILHIFQINMVEY